jgi:prepilin-type N-terminal cleavage/methylation domain-containing protein
MKNEIRKIEGGKEGFTLIEILVSIGIFVGIAFIIGTFMKTVFDYQLLFTQQLSAQQEIENTFATIIPEMRSMIPSALGSYAIGQVSTSSLTFYADIDSDGIADQVRYFLSGTLLKKGIIKPIGSPLVYNTANEVVNDVIHNVVAGAPIFTYYDMNYTGSESAMASPMTISNIRLIRMTVTVKDPNKTTPLSSSVEIVPRNLRTNL